MIYRVEIGFGGYLGVSEEYEVDADSREEAEELALQMAMDDLTVENLEEVEEEED